MRKLVSEKIDCVMQCGIEQCCQSINYKKTSTSQKETNCELLHDIGSYSSVNNMLEKNSSFDHVYKINTAKVREAKPKEEHWGNV
jgi:hypothetical protein